MIQFVFVPSLYVKAMQKSSREKIEQEFWRARREDSRVSLSNKNFVDIKTENEVLFLLGNLRQNSGRPLKFSSIDRYCGRFP